MSSTLVMISASLPPSALSSVRLTFPLPQEEEKEEKHFSDAVFVYSLPAAILYFPTTSCLLPTTNADSTDREGSRGGRGRERERKKKEDRRL